MISEWKAVPGFDGVEASDRGEIRKNGIILKQGSGVYKTVVIAGHTQLVHRLVLLAFIGLPHSTQVGRHLNDNRDDNRLVNLKWGTNRENAENAEDALKNNPNAIPMTVPSSKQEVFEWIRTLRERDKQEAKHLASCEIRAEAIDNKTRRRAKTRVYLTSGTNAHYLVDLLDKQEDSCGES